MTNKPDDPFEVISGAAPSYGWVRRKEFDTDDVDAWEMPDGRLYAAEKGVMPVITRPIIPRKI